MTLPATGDLYNQGRVSSFVGLHRVLELGWKRQEAFALMREIWEPDVVWSAFIEALLATPRVRPERDGV